MGKFRKLTPGGHLEVEFDLALPETVSAVDALFSEAVAQGYTVLVRSGEAVTPVKTFDPATQEDLVAIPQIAGG